MDMYIVTGIMFVIAGIMLFIVLMIRKTAEAFAELLQVMVVIYKEMVEREKDT